MEAPSGTRPDRESLRDFQTRLADRLRAAQAKSTGDSRLGFIAGGRQWLVSLDQVNEVVSLPEMAQTPWSKPWFLGVASVRGLLYGCTDLAIYLGIADGLGKGESRYLLVHPRFGVNAALRVERTVGLRMIPDMSRLPDNPEAAPWVKSVWRSADGEWTELDVEKMVSAPAFMEAGV
jgi:twitching motility protein PilI